MTAPLYVVVLPVSITLCIIADRTPNWRPLYLTAVLCTGGLFSALIAGILNYTARYVFLCFVNIAMWSANPLALSFASTTFGPKEVSISPDDCIWLRSTKKANDWTAGSQSNHAGNHERLRQLGPNLRLLPLPIDGRAAVSQGLRGLCGYSVLRRWTVLHRVGGI
jgi:hypothetical protein